MRERALLLIGFLALLVLVTIGPGLITRHGQHIVCTAKTIGCADSSGGENPFDYHAADGRVDGNAGDLVALYCQREYRTINVYGIDHNAGIFLASFDVDKLQ